MPFKGITLSLSQFMRTKDEHVPKPGEIWWAICSVRETVIQAVNELKLAPPSASMVSDQQFLHYNGEEKKARPCVVIRVFPATGTVTVVPLATLGNTPVATLDRYTKHFCLSIGRTAPWPTATSAVIFPTPSWPLSYIRPCYAISWVTTLPKDAILLKYSWPVEGAEGARDAAAVAAINTSVPIRIASFVLDVTERRKLRREVDSRRKDLEAKSMEEALQMNDSYEASRGRLQ